MTFNSQTRRRLLTRLCGAVTFTGCVLAVTGCQQNPELHGEDFDAPSTPRSFGMYSQAQAAASVAQEGSLQEQDFDGTTLNSLGQVNLDLLVKGTPPGMPVTVKLDFANADEGTYSGREASASAYLEDRGVPTTQIAFTRGPGAKTTPTAAVLPLLSGGGGGAPGGATADEGGSALGGTMASK